MNMNLGKLQEMVRERQGGLVCYSTWGHKETDITGWLKNNFKYRHLHILLNLFLNIEWFWCYYKMYFLIFVFQIYGACIWKSNCLWNAVQGLFLADFTLDYFYPALQKYYENILSTVGTIWKSVKGIWVI